MDYLGQKRMRDARVIKQTLAIGVVTALLPAPLIVSDMLNQTTADTSTHLPWLLLASVAHLAILAILYCHLNQRLLRPVNQLSSRLSTLHTNSIGGEPKRASAGYLARITGQIRETNDRIQSQAVNKKRLSSIGNALSSFVIVSDQSGCLTCCNDRFDRLLKSSGAQPESFRVNTLLTNDVQASVNRLFLDEADAVELTTTWTLPDQRQLPVRLIAIPYQSREDRLLMVATDLSEWSAMQTRVQSLEAERFRYEAALQRSEGRTRELEWALLDTAEREQRRIGRDLHDGLGQRLTGITFLSKVLVSKLHLEAPHLMTSAQWIVALLNEAIDDVRRISRELNPVGFEQTNLGTALQRLVADTTKACGASCELIDFCGHRIPGGTPAMHIYRIIQEAITNSLRHGRASTISVFLEPRPGRIRVAVLDDGIGFDTRQLHAGSGLANMRTRTAMLGGTLRFRSDPDRESGTLMILSIPDKEGVWRT